MQHLSALKLALSLRLPKNMEQLRLSDWLGWRPGEHNASAHSRLLPYEKPGRSLPTMLRRRLDNAGRATCDILAALDPMARFPLVHASRHGDADHTLAMLKTLADNEPPSPTRFSMSVHNATLGVYAIANQHRRPLQALGAGGNEFEALLWEAFGYLHAGHEAVVIVFSEGKLPNEYAPCTTHPGHACGIGLRLTLGNGLAVLSEPFSQAPTSPTPLEVIDWLIGATRHWTIEEA